MAVVLHHINLRFLINEVSFKPHFPTNWARILFWNGANGVTVFFAISGFLITTTVIRRWGSLAPCMLWIFTSCALHELGPLLLALLAVLSVLHLSHVQGFEIPPERASLGRALLAAMTFHINWLEAARGYLPANWDVLWSLSVEEVFYLFFPLICWLTRGATRAGRGACAICRAGPVRTDGTDQKRVLGGVRLFVLHGRHCAGMPGCNVGELFFARDVDYCGRCVSREWS